jgi:hypothetical protein
MAAGSSDEQLVNEIGALCVTVYQRDGWDEARAADVRALLRQAESRWENEPPTRQVTSIFADFFRAIWEQAPHYPQEQADGILEQASAMVDDMMRALGSV